MSQPNVLMEHGQSTLFAHDLHLRSSAISPKSVHDLGKAEADAYKWIESEKAGQDLGLEAIHRWIRSHWNGFLRARWLEHLEGRAFWIELDRESYGLLNRICPITELFRVVFDRVKAGEENLEVILWARQVELPMDEILRILEILNINSRRIECKFLPDNHRYCR